MWFVWIILVAVVYLAIGGIINALIDDPDMFGLMFFWPVFVVMLIFVVIGDVFKRLGRLIVNSVKRLLNKEKT